MSLFCILSTTNYFYFKVLIVSAADLSYFSSFVFTQSCKWQRWWFYYTMYTQRVPFYQSTYANTL